MSERVLLEDLYVRDAGADGADEEGVVYEEDIEDQYGSAWDDAGPEIEKGDPDDVQPDDGLVDGDDEQVEY